MAKKQKKAAKPAKKAATKAATKAAKKTAAKPAKKVVKLAAAKKPAKNGNGHLPKPSTKPQGQAVFAHAEEHAQRTHLEALADRRMRRLGGPGRCGPGPDGQCDVEVRRLVRLLHSQIAGKRRCNRQLLLAEVDVGDGPSGLRADEAA